MKEFSDVVPAYVYAQAGAYLAQQMLLNLKTRGEKKLEVDAELILERLLLKGDGKRVHFMPGTKLERKKKQKTPYILTKPVEVIALPLKPDKVPVVLKAVIPQEGIESQRGIKKCFVQNWEKDEEKFLCSLTYRLGGGSGRAVWHCLEEEKEEVEDWYWRRLRRVGFSHRQSAQILQIVCPRSP